MFPSVSPSTFLSEDPCALRWLRQGDGFLPPLPRKQNPSLAERGRLWVSAPDSRDTQGLCQGHTTMEWSYQLQTAQRSPATVLISTTGFLLGTPDEANLFSARKCKPGARASTLPSGPITLGKSLLLVGPRPLLLQHGYIDSDQGLQIQYLQAPFLH